MLRIKFCPRWGIFGRFSNSKSFVPRVYVYELPIVLMSPVSFLNTIVHNYVVTCQKTVAEKF